MDYVRIKDLAIHSGISYEEVKSYAKTTGTYFSINRIELIRVENLALLIKKLKRIYSSTI